MSRDTCQIRITTQQNTTVLPFASRDTYFEFHKCWILHWNYKYIKRVDLESYYTNFILIYDQSGNTAIIWILLKQETFGNTEGCHIWWPLDTSKSNMAAVSIVGQENPSFEENVGGFFPKINWLFETFRRDIVWS